ncbi:MAG: hypothetical protein OHK0052_25610 [Anaerolineales bacterium]
MSDDVWVVKQDVEGRETWRYRGRVLAREAAWLRLEAFFNREDTLFHGIWLKKGDRFVETFYTDRWYNVFAMYDRDDGGFKGWYCNVCFPAEFADDAVCYRDLALDLLVYRDGRQVVLDEDEFALLHLPPEAGAQALVALAQLQALNWKDVAQFG